MKKTLEMQRKQVAAQAASPVRFWGRRSWANGASAICFAAMTAIIGAGPSTAPTASSTTTPMLAAPTTAPSMVMATPTTLPVAPVAAATPTRQPDQSNQNRNNRGSNNRGSRNRGNGNNNSDNNANAVANASGDPYGILQQRSIFIKGNQSTTPPNPESRPQVPRDTIYRERPPSQLIFNGVTVINDRPEAFVEDLGSNVVGTVSIGDAVAGGTVLAINFNDLAYLVRGQTKHVGLGQNFNGDSAFALATPAAPTTNAVTPTAPGQIVGAGASIPGLTAPTASGLSSEDILARMKAKRAQESQQIGK